MADFTGSITLQSGSTGQYQLVLSVWENSYSVANNTSNVGWSLKVKSINSYYSYWGVAHTYKVVINGSTVYNTSKTMTVDKGATATVASGTTTVTHSNDGSKTISCSGSMSNPNYADSGVPKSGSCSGSLKLTTIPRATTPSLNLSGGTNFGNTITVKGTSASSSFSHKVYYNVNGESAWNYIGDVGSGSTSISKSWTIPTSLMNKIPNGTTMQINMSLDTYSGSTKIGTKGVSFTATVPSNIVPSISSVSVSEAVSDIASTFGYYIQGKSKLAFSVSASGTYGSTIKSIIGTVNNTGYTASSGKFTTNTIDKSGSISYTIKTTDSRGRTSSKTGSVTMVAYTNPTVTGTVQRATEAYEVDEQEGIYALCNFSYSIYPLDDNNLKGFILQYRKSTDSAWTTLNEWTDEYSLSDYQYEAGNLLESTSAYNFRFGVMDYFNQNYIFSYATIEPTYTLINFRNTGKGIAFGGQSEGDDFTCNMDANINGDVTINNATFMMSHYRTVKYGVAHICTLNNSDWLKTYIKICQINIMTSYVNYPINLELSRRSTSGPITLSIVFANTSETDPSLAGFYVMNQDASNHFYMVKEASGQWGCYLKRSDDAYDWTIVDKVSYKYDNLYTIKFYDSDKEMYCCDTLPSSTVTEATEYYTPFYKMASTSSSGLMSASDKSKLNDIASGANKITVDSSLSTTSTNPVQNKLVGNSLLEHVKVANLEWGTSLTVKNAPAGYGGILLVSGQPYGVWSNGSGNNVMLYHPGTNTWSSNTSSVTLQGLTCKKSGSTLTFSVSSNATLTYFFRSTTA